MEIKQIWAVYWSATGNTRRTAETVAGELAKSLDRPLKTLNFTPPRAREAGMAFAGGDLVVFAVPTYAGKVPNKLLPYLQERTAGNGALAVPLVTFGNRSFDNSLAELCAVLEHNGFHTVAAGAFACRHAFTDQLAYGRPGWSDEQEMKALARSAADRVRGLDAIPAPVRVPGDAAAPYYVPKGTDGAPAKFLKAKPKTNPARCTNCGACVRLCPMGAIDPADVGNVPGTCIKCQACIRGCTKGAKFFDDPAFLSHVAMLEQTFTEPKENQVFL